MPTTNKRITIVPDLEAIVASGRDIRPGKSGQWSDATQQVNGIIRRYALLIESATREIDTLLTRSEWNLIADVNNGCADLWDYSGTDLPMLGGILANVEDGDRLNHSGKKWKVDVSALLGKLRALTSTHGEAIADAVRWFWDHSDDIDHAKDPWWTVAFRKKSLREGD